MGRRKWTKDRIIQEILALHKAGEPLSTRNMARLGYSGMVTTSYKPELFGGWRNAIRAANLDPRKVCTRRRKWTRERIVQRIRELHEQGEDLSHSAAKRNHQYLVVVAADSRAFRSWRAAVEAAGIKYDRVSKHDYWSEEKIVQRIQAIHRRGGSLSHEEAKRKYGPLVSAASSRRYFGSWANAIHAAGLDYDEIRRISRWDKRKIVQKIRELHRQGRELNNSSMRRMGYRGMMEAASRPRNFGSWAKAIEAAGLDYDSIRKC
jgi:tRNA A37 N6-isopentenylltransferase MiaA